MKVLSGSGRYACPTCNTIVELCKDDINSWNSVHYYECPKCGNIVHIAGGALARWLCPYNISGKKAKPVR